MSPDAQLVLQGLLFVMLTMVGLLLVWLHFRLQEFLEARKKMPMLADELTEVMLKARSSIAQLMTGVSEKAPELDKKLHESNKVLQEFDYVLDRANKVLERLDVQLDKLRHQGVELSTITEPAAEPSADVEHSASVTPLRPAVAAAYGARVVSPTGATTASDTEDELRRALSQRL